MICVKRQAGRRAAEAMPSGAGLTAVNACDAGPAPDGRMPSQPGAADMTNEFEWTDFAMQSPCVMAELLDAAGIDGGIPGRDLNGPDEEAA
jgi:hypothetical protein